MKPSGAVVNEFLGIMDKSRQEVCKGTLWVNDKKPPEFLLSKQQETDKTKPV